MIKMSKDKTIPSASVDAPADVPEHAPAESPGTEPSIKDEPAGEQEKPA